uniref:hypothetical protein n=1 Tax=Herbidospora mongoliensis TaxID=688067 RepID=UPI0012FB82BF|nr:hypothetical protein [Herbidospora mongoliensis]
MFVIVACACRALTTGRKRPSPRVAPTLIANARNILGNLLYVYFARQRDKNRVPNIEFGDK